MGLAAYRKKRDFRKTPEPRGSVSKRRGSLRFTIQKHAASRLHYDFRLEAGGVLKSWAVPKGPSLDPGARRLAVEVEDHPLEYGSFEGTIPKGEYGGGSVLLWDQGTWIPEGDPEAALRKGRLSFELHGTKLRGGFSLVRIRGDDEKSWLLLKRRDEWARPERGGGIVEERPESVASGKRIEEIGGDPAGKVWRSHRRNGAAPRSVARRGSGSRREPASPSAPSLPGGRKAALPEVPEAQLATLVSAAPAGDDWVHEIKYDGYRMLCRLDRGHVRILSRRAQDWTERLPELAGDVRGLGAERAILDGELVVLEPDGKSNFQALQNRMRASHEGELVFYAFDLLHLDGYDLARVPLESRKAALAALLGASGRAGMIRYSDHVQGRGPEFHAEACRRGIEGIVSKRRGSLYVPGRSGSWLKTKCSARQELVIGGYTEPQGSRSGFGALLLGVPVKGGGLRYCGRVGTGFTRESLEELRAKLAALGTTEGPFREGAPSARGVHWVRPRLVAEVSFAAWTEDGMLRHPSFRGLREDKAPGDVTREMPAAVPSKPGRDADAARAVPRPSARKRTPTVRRRPPETPPRRRPPLKEPEPKPAVEEPPAKRRKRPVREPVDAAETPAGGFALTNPDRVLYPEQGLTKLDLARYAHAVAERMVPHAAGRPLMLLRCPEGRERCFFQKHPSGPLPESLAPIPVRERKGTATYVTLQDESGLLALVQMGVLEIHVWGARGDQLERPDRIVVDLDPHPSMPWAEVVEAARLARRRLEALDLVSFPKTTGGKGIHVVVPIRRGPGWDEVRAFTDWLAAELAREDPKRYSTRLSKERRGTRLFVDTLRNRRGATWVAPYSPRARAGAPVSMPLSWEDLDPRRGPDRYTVESVLRRGLPRTDPWRELGSARQTLTAAHRKAARSASARRPS